MKPVHRTCPPVTLLLALILALVLPCRAAQADDPPDAGAAKEDYVLETVKVTAQKREENVQEIPGSVSVLSDVTLEQSRVTKIKDLEALAPNLYFGTAGEGTHAFVSIRGRGNSQSDIDPTVTIFIDGVPYDDYYTMDSGLLFDVERVEVLRGPQSTLYGLNSIGGVINVITKQPGDEPRATVGAEISGGPDRDMSTMTKASVSGPVVQDVFSLGVAGFRLDEGGWVYNLYDDGYSNGGGKTAARINAVWTPVEKLEVRSGLTITEIDMNSGNVYVPVDDAAAQAIGRPGIDDWELDQNYPGYVEMRTIAPNLNVRYEAPWFDIVSVTAFRDTDQEFGVDFDLTRNDLWEGIADNEVRTFTQEFRLQSPDHGDEDAFLDWTVGYFRHDLMRDEKKILNGNAFSGGILKGASNAVFGQATYRLFDNALGLTAGGRYESTERKLRESVPGYDDVDTDDSQFLPKVAVDYRFTPDIMTYASAAMGWRTGGVNHLARVAGHLEYDKETCWTYELGFKTSFLDNTLIVNGAVFHSEYEDYQDMVQMGLQTYLANVDGATMDGFEIEAVWNALKNLEFTGSLGYVDAEYGDYPNAADGNYEGNKIMSIPEFDMNLAAKYTFLEHWYVRPEFVCTGEIYWDRANKERQGSYHQINLRLGWARDSWEIYVFGDNLTNEYAFTTGTDYLGDGNYFGSPIRPLTVGLGVNWNY